MYRKTKITNINSVRKISLLKQWFNQAKGVLCRYFAVSALVEMRAYHMTIKHKRIVFHALIKTAIVSF